MKRIVAKLVSSIVERFQRVIDRQYLDMQGRGLLYDPQSRATMDLLLETLQRTNATGRASGESRVPGMETVD